VLLPALGGTSLAVPYLLMVGYSAPRFLLPAFALLALPCGVVASRGLLAGAQRNAVRRRRWSVVAVVAVAAVTVTAMTAQLVSQQRVFNQRVQRAAATGQQYASIAADLRRFGVRAPCAVSGHEAAPVAYYAGCASRYVVGHDASITAEALTGLSRRLPVATIVVGDRHPPRYARDWARHPLAGSADGGSWVGYVSGHPNS
jgi:predicted alpha/beta hydrolase